MGFEKGPFFSKIEFSPLVVVRQVSVNHFIIAQRCVVMSLCVVFLKMSVFVSVSVLFRLFLVSWLSWLK
jgi:hypothetical protein